ncbi:hypothetical protein NY547_15795 [Cnuibacter physcomitrellae]|uniref:hypothetical protein n=1 Tax=Cnuibacter physcomitrellae TaxID=1619308 RepID=UPI00217594DC|nr:hypothetical protein [Cnuibacter physcomitrellae]MCS5498713.1 hypothetical protein [Cnuibacter physcomitrellae]
MTWLSWWDLRVFPIIEQRDELHHEVLVSLEIDPLVPTDDVDMLPAGLGVAELNVCLPFREQDERAPRVTAMEEEAERGRLRDLRSIVMEWRTPRIVRVPPREGADLVLVNGQEVEDAPGGCGRFVEFDGPHHNTLSRRVLSWSASL